MADDPSLKSKLAASLPQQQRFVIHHLSTPPTSSPALYSAPPGQIPEKTTCESHFLSVTIRHHDRRIQIFALEVLIYATRHLTTLFVSKADSTGYIHLLKLPKGSPSPLRTISSIFITHLVKGRQRKDRQLVVSLFARSQDQYLFPGSIENPGKHVLDDRALIKWWCRVLEPVLQSSNSDTESSELSPAFKKKPPITTAKAYLRVPSCDLHETRSFFPPHVRRSPTLLSKWHPNRDPLRDLAGRSPTFPERCLIPRFPDDPKSRFVDELDEELTEPPSDSPTKESPSKGKRPGRWKSVRSLEQFWELMAFRQECSSGRLVGFLWAVFTPAQLEERLKASGPIPFAERIMSKPHKGDGPKKSAHVVQPPSTPSAENLVDADLPNAGDQVSLPGTTARAQGPPGHPPPAEASALILPAKHYARINRLLLHLDYANLEIAAESSERWIDDVGICAGKKDWGFEVVGEKELDMGKNSGGGEATGVDAEGKGADGVNTLDMGLVRKNRRVEGDAPLAPGEKGNGPDGGVNVLATGLVRKRPKIK
ncbi:MAG: hypothetical protein LQ349_005715 [Xanthoria aureola]|nr:MAG: hypothetical protein LQ349_005715 [Xanthoria aureola]